MIWTVVVVICMWSSLGLETSGKVIEHFRRQDKNDLQRGSTVSSPKLRCNCCCTVTKTNVQLLCVCDTVTARRIHVGNGNVTTHCLQNGLNYTSELILHNLTFYARCKGHAGFHDLEKLHKVGVQRHGIPVLTFKLKIYHASTILTCTAKWTNTTGVKTFCITKTRSHKDMKCIIDKKDPRHEHKARLGSRPTDKTVQKLSLALERSHTLATAKHYWYLIIKCPKVTHNLSSSCHMFHVKLNARASNKNETFVSLISCLSISNHTPEPGKQSKGHKNDTKDRAELSVRHRRQVPTSTPATANNTNTNDSKDSSSNEALAIHYIIIYVLAAGVVGAIISAVTPRLLRLWRSHQAHIKEVMGNQASISTTSVESGHLYESIPNINAPFHRRLHVTWSEIRTLSRDNMLTLSNTSIDDPDTVYPLLRSGSTGCPLHGNSHSKLPRRGIDSDGYMIPLPYMKSALAESLDNIIIDNTQPDTDTYVTPITPPESGSVSTRSSIDNLSTEAHSIGTNSAYHRESCFTSLYQSVRSLGSNSSYTEAPDSCTCEQCVDCLYAKGGQIHNSHHSYHMESLRSLPAQLCTEKGTMGRNICHGQNLPVISQDCRGQNVADERTLTMSSRLVHVEIKATTAHENVRRSLTYGEELERSTRLNVNSIVQHLDHHQTLTTASRQSCQMCHHQHHVSLQPCKRAATYTPCQCGRHTSKQYHTLAPTQEYSSHTTKGKYQIKASSQTHCPLHAQNTSPNTAAEQDYVNTSVPSERRPCPPPPRHQSSSDQLYINTIPPNRPNLPFPEPRMAQRQDKRDIPFQEPRKAQRKDNRDISLPEPRMAQRQDNRDISFLESGKAQRECNKDIQFPESGITQREGNGDIPFPEPIKDQRQDNRDIPCPEPGMAKRKDNRDTYLPGPRKAQRQDNKDIPIPVPRKAKRKENSDKTASSMSLDRGLRHNMQSQGPQLQVPRCSGSAADLSNIYF